MTAPLEPPTRHVKNGPDCTCPNDDYHDRVYEPFGLRALNMHDDDGCYESGRTLESGLHHPSCNAIRNGGPCDVGRGAESPMSEPDDVSTQHVEPPTPPMHYGSNGAAECGADRASVTLDVDKVTCRTCRGWLPIVAPPMTHQDEPMGAAPRVEDNWPELLGAAYSLISDAIELGGLDTPADRERWRRVATEWLAEHRIRKDRLQRRRAERLESGLHHPSCNAIRNAGPCDAGRGAESQ